MNVTELLDAGNLASAIDRLSETLKERPNDLRARTSLFELLCYAGELGRAERQLDVLSHQDAGPGAQVGALVYRNLLDAEKKRNLLFGQGVRPRFMLEPSPAVALHLDALDRLRAGSPAEARALLDRAAEQHRPIRGTTGGAEFDDFRDADDLLAPVLEVFAPAGYCWVPWDQIQFLEVPPPESLRDLLWTPAKLASFDGQLGEVFLPNLYPGSSSHADGLVRLGRKTDWQDVGAGIVRGIGQKVFLVGDEAMTLLELREVRFKPAADGPEAH